MSTLAAHKLNRAITLAALILGLAGVAYSPMATAKTTDRIQKTKLKYKPAKPKYKLQWKLKFSGASYADATDEANLAGTLLNLKSHIKFGEYFSFIGDGMVVMSAGRVQSRFNQNSVKNGVGLNEALINAQFVDERVQLQAGVIDQGFLEDSQFVSGSFPGARAIVHIQKSRSKLFPGHFRSGTRVVVQSTIPTSQSLDSERAEKEETPSLTTESIISDIKINKFLGLELNATHYKYSNLPASVAAKSALNGNSVFDAGQPTARFAFDFEGVSLKAVGHIWPTKKMTLNAGATLTNNQKALEGYGRSYKGFVGAGYGSPRSNLYSIEAGQFFTEGDSAPSYYMSSKLGLQNRAGTYIRTGAEFSRLGFKTFLDFADADVLEARSTMSRQQTIVLSLETYYEDIL